MVGEAVELIGTVESGGEIVDEPPEHRDVGPGRGVGPVAGLALPADERHRVLGGGPPPRPPPPAARTVGAMSAGSTLLDVTTPTRVVSPRRTAITVQLREREIPLVVIELPAHRSDASPVSVTSTIVSSAVEQRNARSSCSCASIIAGPPRGC